MAPTRSQTAKEAAKKGTKNSKKKPTKTTTKRVLPKKATKKAKKRKVESESEDESDRIQKLEAENQKLRAISQAAAASTSRSKKGKKQKAGTVTAVQRLLMDVTKQFLFPKVKVIRNEAQLLKATRMIMDRLDLQNLNGLEGQDLATAQEIWIMENKEHVLHAINNARNYVNQETQKVMSKVFAEGKAEEFPDPDCILKCALRDAIQDFDDEDDLAELKKPQGDKESDAAFKKREAKLQDLEGRIASRDRNRVIFDNYLDVLLPKVSGFRHYGPKNRHAFVPSFTYRGPQDTDQDGDPPVPLVTASDEAFMVALFENSYKRWKYVKECELANKVPDKEEAVWDTAYTNLRGGQKAFGGWETAGRKRIKELKDMIEENRATNKEYLIQVEEAAVKRLRKKHGKSEVAAATNKKRKGAPAVAEPDESDDDDSFFADPKEADEDTEPESD